MTYEYTILTDQLHSTKRHLVNLRSKCTNLENDISSLQQEYRALKSSYESLKQSYDKAIVNNSKLQRQKQQIASNYSNSLEQIKMQINKKNQQLVYYGQSDFKQGWGEGLMRKHIKCEIQQQYKSLLDIKEGKIIELTKEIQQVKTQNKLEKQKYLYKLKMLEKQMEDNRQQHLVQLEKYSAKLDYKSHTNQHMSQLRKIRREVDQLRNLLTLKNQQIQIILEEKFNLSKQLNETVKKNSADMTKALSQGRIHKMEADRLAQILDKNNKDTQNYLNKQKDKQIKRLKNTIQEMHEDILKRDQNIQNLSIEIVQIRGENKKIKIASKIQNNQTFENIARERDFLAKEVQTLRQMSQQINTETVNHQLGLNSSINRKVSVQPATNDQHLQPTLYQAQKAQITKKLRDLQNNNRKLKEKLEIANSKIVELLRHKIALNSPQNSKKIMHQTEEKNHSNTYPNDPEINYFPRQPQIMHINQEFKKVNEKDMRDFLSPNYSPDKIRQQSLNVNRTLSSGSKGFYEKSLKIKHQHKLKELKCANHQNNQLIQ